MKTHIAYDGPGTLIWGAGYFGAEAVQPPAPDPAITCPPGHHLSHVGDSTVDGFDGALPTYETRPDRNPVVG